MAGWSAPLALITCEENDLRLNSVVAKKLEEIDKPLVTVCIAGPYRTGKSYLMNRLAGKQSGFALGATVEALTKGIWVWYVDHPKDKNKGLLLMDTEGLGDPARGDETYDMWILCLSILLSSTFIYNTFGKIDNSLIDTMHFVGDISEHIRVQTGDKSDADFDGFFPTFVLAIRDATLELKLDGKDVTEDEYMERMMLQARKSTTKREEQRNIVKQKLRRYFPKRKCFFFERPVATDKELSQLDYLTEWQLQPNFLIKNNEFAEYVYKTAQLKKIDKVQPVDGRIFVHMTKLYLQEIHNGSVPCVGSAVEMIAKTENELALKNSVEKYRNSMQQKLQLPVDMQELQAAHAECHKTAIAFFLKKVFLDGEKLYHEKLQTRLNEQYVKIANENTVQSQNKCNKILDNLCEPINNKLRNGSYLKQNGYKEFSEDLKHLEHLYNATPKKGVMGDAVLQKFLNLRKIDQETILGADQMLSESQRIIERERMLKEESQRQYELKAEELKQMKQHEEALLKSNQEQVEAMKRAYFEKAQEQQQVFEEQLKARQEEQERLIKENFEAEARLLQTQIDALKNTQKKSIWGGILSTVGTVMSFLPNPIARGAGLAVSFVSSFFK